MGPLGAFTDPYRNIIFTKNDVLILIETQTLTLTATTTQTVTLTQTLNSNSNSVPNTEAKLKPKLLIFVHVKLVTDLVKKYYKLFINSTNVLVPHKRTMTST